MRQFAWYSPELNVIVMQLIMEECYISFEWDHCDICEVALSIGLEVEPMGKFLWLPLGEI